MNTSFPPQPLVLTSTDNGLEIPVNYDRPLQALGTHYNPLSETLSCKLFVSDLEMKKRWLKTDTNKGSNCRMFERIVNDWYFHGEFWEAWNKVNEKIMIAMQCNIWDDSSHREN